MRDTHSRSATGACTCCCSRRYEYKHSPDTRDTRAKAVAYGHRWCLLVLERLLRYADVVLGTNLFPDVSTGLIKSYI